MTFVTAWLAVAGAAAMSIPIIIHLLSRQRRKPIEWAAMRFLIEAFRKHRRRLQLEQLLLLLTRCLIVLLLGAALARPLLEHAGLLDHGAGRVVYFVVDDGTISGLTGDDGRTALDKHIDQAMQLMESLDASDAIGVISAARPADGRLIPPSSDHRAVRRLLESMTPVDSPTDFPAALRLLSRTLETQEHEHDHVFVYLLSEFRAGSADLDESLPTLSGLDDRIQLLAAPYDEASIDNVTVSAIEPVRHVVAPGLSDGSGQISVRLKRSGGALESQASRVRLEGDDIAPLEPRTVRWEPGQSEASVSFMVEFAADRERELTLTASIDEDALGADNTRRAVLHLRPQIRVTMLDRRRFGTGDTIDHFRPGQWMQRALEPFADSPITVTTVDPTTFSVADVRATEVIAAPRPDLISEDSWAVLRDFVDRGGLLLITPPAELNVHQWTERLTSEFDLPWRLHLEVEEAVDEEGFLLATEQPSTEILRLIAGDLEDLVTPVVTYRRLVIDRDQTRATTLLAFEDEQPLVMMGMPQERANGQERENDNRRDESRGLVVLVTSAPDLSWTNLPSKPLMLPLMQEIVRQGMSMIRGQEQYAAGEQPRVARIRHAEALIGPDGERIILDETGRANRPLTRAGRYELHDAAGQRIHTFAVNIEPDAANADPQPASTVMSWLAESGPWAVIDERDPVAALRTAKSGSPIAGILLALLLLLIVLETLLARWFSHAYREDEMASASGPTIRPQSSERTAEAVA